MFKFLKILLYRAFPICLPAIAIILSSCGDSLGLEERVIIEQVPAEILPLKIGNRWDYEITRYNTAGGIDKVSETKYEITGSISLNDEIWYIQHQGTDDPGVLKYLINKSDGLWQKNSPGSEASLLSPYPCKVGEEYLVSKYIDSQSGKAVEIIRRVDEIYRVIAINSEKFHCIMLSDRQQMDNTAIGPNPLNVIYYAPNIGFVRRERYSNDENGKSYLFELWELKSYQVSIDKP